VEFPHAGRSALTSGRERKSAPLRDIVQKRQSREAFHRRNKPLHRNLAWMMHIRNESRAPLLPPEPPVRPLSIAAVAPMRASHDCPFP
jgi:hypothetical protein